MASLTNPTQTMMFTRKFKEPTELPECPTAERWEKIDAIATHQKSGWKLQSVERPEIVVVHAALPVAISDMKKRLGLDSLTITI